MHCGLEQPIRKQLKLSKDLYPFSNQPAPLEGPDLEGKDSGDSLRGKFAGRGVARL